jgi:quinol monooxygenase YgiN
MIIVSGTFIVPPEQHEAMVEAIGALVAPTRAEPGCLDFEFWADLHQRGRFHVSELWASEASFAAHLATPHLGAFREARARLGTQFSLRRFRAEDLPQA